MDLFNIQWTGKLLKIRLNIYNLGNPEQKRKFMKSMVENFVGGNLQFLY